MLYSTVPRCGARNAAISRTSAGVMCRSSARGCTVMPGAPCVDHDPHGLEHRRLVAAARVAQRGDLVDVDGEADHGELGAGAAAAGTVRGSRREGAPALAIAYHPAMRAARRAPHGEVGADGVGDLVGPGADLGLVAALEHDPQQRLGARVAHQQAAVAVETRLDVAHRGGHRRHLRDVGAFADAHVHEHLRIAGQRRRPASPVRGRSRSSPAARAARWRCRRR